MPKWMQSEQDKSANAAQRALCHFYQTGDARSQQTADRLFREAKMPSAQVSQVIDDAALVWDVLKREGFTSKKAEKMRRALWRGIDAWLKENGLTRYCR